MACQIGAREDVDPLVRLAMKAVLVPDRDKAASRKPRSLSELRRADERRTASPPRPTRSDPFRSSARSRTDNTKGSRDSGAGCVVRNHRRGKSRMAVGTIGLRFLIVRAAKSLAAEGQSPIGRANPSGAGHLFEPAHRRANRPRVSMLAAHSIAGEFKDGEIIPVELAAEIVAAFVSITLYPRASYPL